MKLVAVDQAYLAGVQKLNGQFFSGHCWLYLVIAGGIAIK